MSLSQREGDSVPSIGSQMAEAVGLDDVSVLARKVRRKMPRTIPAGPLIWIAADIQARYGFVAFKDPEDFLKAWKTMDGTSLRSCDARTFVQ